MKTSAAIDLKEQNNKTLFADISWTKRTYKSVACRKTLINQVPNESISRDFWWNKINAKLSVPYLSMPTGTLSFVSVLWQIVNKNILTLEIVQTKMSISVNLLKPLVYIAYKLIIYFIYFT